MDFDQFLMNRQELCPPLPLLSSEAASSAVGLAATVSQVRLLLLRIFLLLRRFLLQLFLLSQHRISQLLDLLPEIESENDLYKKDENDQLTTTTGQKLLSSSER